MVSRTSIVAIAATVIIASACAKRPNAISATTIPVSAYENMSCDELTAALVAEKTNLSALSKSQNSAATADAVGVFLVGVPAGSLAGNDNEGEISLSKGKVVAIEANITRKRC